MATVQDYTIGEQVIFGRNQGEKTLGTVIGKGPIKLKIRQDEVRGAHPVGTIWSVPANTCQKTGTVVAPKAKRSDAVIMAEIQSVYCHLSPENLSCDGELSRSQVASRAASLRQQLRTLFTEIGRQVTESEAYGHKPYGGERTPVTRDSYAPAKTSGFKVGDKVSFDDGRGNLLVGFVKSVNQKTISVQPIGGGTRYWRVSPRLLKAA